MNTRVLKTSCPLCGADCYMAENSDGNGKILTTFAYDIRWLGYDEGDIYDNDLLDIDDFDIKTNTYGGGR